MTGPEHNGRITPKSRPLAPVPPDESGKEQPAEEAMLVKFGQAWQPAPFAYQVITGTMQGQKAIFLIFDSGRHIRPMAVSEQEARGLNAQLTKVTTGLTIATGL